MNLQKIDLNLLVYLDVLLRERSVTKAAQYLGISQPALSNGLKRLRNLFEDPLLVRTSEGMSATEKAIAIAPMIRSVVTNAQSIFELQQSFSAKESRRVFRIMCSDYAEAALLPSLIQFMRHSAPGIILDCLTPSDVSYKDMELGRVDMAINRFNDLPASFYQKTIWWDDFSCLLSASSPLVDHFNLDLYVKARHIWVSKTGLGVGTGINPDQSATGLGWIDSALHKLGKKRRISIFTRHYSIPALLVANSDLVATLPTKVAMMQMNNPDIVVRKPPFLITPFELKMAWSPLLHHHPAHRWLRQSITVAAKDALANSRNDNKIAD